MRLSLWASILLAGVSSVVLAVSLGDSSYQIKWVPLTKPFEGDVRFLENFPGDPNSLLVLYWHALGRIQIKDSTWSQEVIVGKTSPGNSDGKGDAAGFYQPSSVRALNDTTVVISDSGNFCLRMVDLKSKYSRAHAGICGKKDRMYSRVSLENARFGYPVGLLKRDKGVYIADRDNHALMLMTDNSVKQEAGGKDWFKFPTNLAGISDQVYISFRHGLARFSPDSGNLVKIIAGQNSGNLAGNFQNDMFKYPTSLVSVSNSTLLMADTQNYRVAVISLSDQAVTTICTADTSSSDDSKDYCNQDYPYSIAIINSRILVGRSGGGIREIISKSLQNKLPTTVSTMPKTMPTTTPKTVLKTTLITTLNKTPPATPTTTTKIPTIPQTVLPTTVPIAEEACPPPHVDLELKPGETSAYVQWGYINLHFETGLHKAEINLRNGTLCITTIHVTDAVKLICPLNFAVQISRGAVTTEVNWKLPELVGVNRSEIQCVLCPAQQQQLTSGIHSITYRYIYLPTNYTIGCSFQIVVSKFRADRCESETILALRKGKDTVIFQLKLGDGMVIPVKYPVGVHTVEISSQSGVVCMQTVRVYDNKVSERLVNLRVSYQVDCSKLDEPTLNIMKSVLAHEHGAIARACTECELPSDPVFPDIECSSGLLSASWKTNITIPIQNSELSRVVQTPLTSKLRKIQEDNLKFNGRFLDITVITLTPPTIFPVSGSDGLYLNPVVVSTCPLPQMIYDEDDDACYMPTN